MQDVAWRQVKLRVVCGNRRLHALQEAARIFPACACLTFMVHDFRHGMAPSTALVHLISCKLTRGAKSKCVWSAAIVACTLRNCIWLLHGFEWLVRGLLWAMPRPTTTPVIVVVVNVVSSRFDTRIRSASCGLHKRWQHLLRIWSARFRERTDIVMKLFNGPWLRHDFFADFGGSSEDQHCRRRNSRSVAEHVDELLLVCDV